MKASEVTNAIFAAKTPAQKAAATRKQNVYLEEQKKLGHDPVRTMAAIKAIVTRKKQKLENF